MPMASQLDEWQDGFRLSGKSQFNPACDLKLLLSPVHKGRGGGGVVGLP